MTEGYCCQNLWKQKIVTIFAHKFTHTHTRLMALCPGLPRWAGLSGFTKVKPTWILLKQEKVSGSGISWAICKSASCSRQSCQHPTSKFFTGRMPFLPPNQRCQSTAHTFTDGHKTGGCCHPLQSNLSKWIPLKWITHLNGYNLSGPI